MAGKKLSSRAWFYPVVYGLLIIISMLPPITQIPYDPRNTQDVIMNILMISILPYQSWGWLFHISTLALIALTIYLPKSAGRVIAAYFGINYLIISALQTNAVTEKYGFAVQIGAMVTTALLGVVWIRVAWQDKVRVSVNKIPPWRWLLLPFALLVFWSPISIEGSKVIPNFKPLLLLTSPDYGLTYCFLTPVFLYFLILLYPLVDTFAFRITAFNGLLYGLFNLTHWFNPDMIWMGFMHVPLLVIPSAALLMPVLERKRKK